MGTKIEELRTLGQESIAIPWWAAHAALAEHDAEVAALTARAEKAEREHNAEWAARVRAEADLAGRTRALTLERDRLAAELATVRGSGGVLTREECAAASSAVAEAGGFSYADQSGRRYNASAYVVRVPAVGAWCAEVSVGSTEDLVAGACTIEHAGGDAWTGTVRRVHTLVQAGARAQHARDEVLRRAEVHKLTTRTNRQIEDLIAERDATEVASCRKALDAARDEVERLKAATPTPPADLDGYVQIVMGWLAEGPEASPRRAVAAVIAARDAWWEARLLSHDAVVAAARTDAAGTPWFARAALRAAIAAVKASDAPAPAQPTGTVRGTVDGPPRWGRGT